MALKTNKWAAATSLAAAFSMLAAAPAEARGWGGRHYRDRVDIGDVLTGVLIIGGIAAIANAAKNRENTRGYPLPRSDDGYRYRTPGGYERSDGRGMDRAVDMCVDEVERRSGRVASVDGANRNADGWQVSGELERGAGYSCRIGNDGRISDVQVTGEDYGYGYGTAPAVPVEDRQWSDEDYARARAAQDAPEPQADETDDGRYTTAQAPDFEV